MGAGGEGVTNTERRAHVLAIPSVGQPRRLVKNNVHVKAKRTSTAELFSVAQMTCESSSTFFLYARSLSRCFARAESTSNPSVLTRVSSAFRAVAAESRCRSTVLSPWF